MADFRPHLGLTLNIGAAQFTFVQHPLFPDDQEEVFAIEGGEAMVYQLREVASGKIWTLKVSKTPFRGKHILRSTNALAPYAHLPGLSLGRRVCFTKATHPALIAAHPGLEYAVLMPWLSGQSWAGFLANRATGPDNEPYTPQVALKLAIAMAQVLWDLEAHSLAHTDIAGSNVLLMPAFNLVELLDLENLYMPNSPIPQQCSQGSPGYQHRSLDRRGYWRPDGDRFSGAIIITEMLTWCDARVQKLTPPNAESLFPLEDLQQINTPRWRVVRDALWNICPPALRLFDQAWSSTDLSQCPELSAWAMTLIQMRK
ncbi:MAG TPA: hypothetical protein VFB60_12460 [Ktedonobacteraceae bacterium]|nr:hypothetical protein [Ktedonobacteraceae bacterium]